MMTEIEQEISEAMANNPNYPLGETDAMKWAVAWRLTRDRVGIDANASQASGDIDGWMVGWFANCMASASPSMIMQRGAWSNIMTDKADNDALADLIETRLFGVAPDDQDLVLEDDDWRTILAALRTRRPDETETLRAEVARLREALGVADAAIKEMFRYYDGGETRGSYDGKPERNQLRKAGYATTAALKGTDHE